MVERIHGMDEVTSSSLVASTYPGLQPQVSGPGVVAFLGGGWGPGLAGANDGRSGGKNFGGEGAKAPDKAKAA